MTTNEEILRDKGHIDLLQQYKKETIKMMSLARQEGAKDEREKILNGKISEDVVSDADFLEELSALEHKQWEHWSKELSKRMEKTCQENNGLIAFSMEMKQRWTPNWKTYEELSEDVKEYDRKWARLAASVCNKGYSFCYEKGKQAGRDEATKQACDCIKDGEIANNCPCFEAGQKEALTDKYSLFLDSTQVKIADKRLIEKIAALEALFNDKGKPSFLKMLKEIRRVGLENARLKEECLQLCNLNDRYIEKNTVLQNEIDDFKAGRYNGAKVIREEIRMLGVVSKENARLREIMERMFPIIITLQVNHNWYVKRGGLLPYDWQQYMGKYLFELESEMKIAKKALEVRE